MATVLELPEVIAEGTLLIPYGGWPGLMCSEGHQFEPGMSCVLVEAGPPDEDWHLAVCWCGKQLKIRKDDPEFLTIYAEHGVEVKPKPDPVERVPITTLLLVKNMAGKTRCPSGHKYYQSLHEGRPGSDFYIGVCSEDPSCATYFYPVPKDDPEVAKWLEAVLTVCEPCQQGEHTCIGFRWDRCNCPCRDYFLRHLEVTPEQVARKIIQNKYGIEPATLPELTEEGLRDSHTLALLQIEIDRMKIRSLQLRDQNRPRHGDD